MRHVPRPFSTFGRSSAVSRSRSSAVSVDSIARPVLVRCCEVTSRVLLVAEHRGVAPSPFPHRRRADHLGVEDLLLVAELSGAETNRAEPKFAAALGELFEQPLKWRASFAGDSGHLAWQAEPHGVLGRPHDYLLALPEGTGRNQEREEHTLGVFHAGGKVDENLPVHRLLPPSGGPVARLALRLSLLFHERRTFRPFGGCRRCRSMTTGVLVGTPPPWGAPERPVRLRCAQAGDRPRLGLRGWVPG